MSDAIEAAKTEVANVIGSGDFKEGESASEIQNNLPDSLLPGQIIITLPEVENGDSLVSVVERYMLRVSDTDVMAIFRTNQMDEKILKLFQESEDFPKHTQSLINAFERWMTDLSQNENEASLKQQAATSRRSFFVQTLRGYLEDESLFFVGLPYGFARLMFGNLRSAAESIALQREVTNKYTEFESGIADLSSCPLWIFVIYLEIFYFETNSLFLSVLRSPYSELLSKEYNPSLQMPAYEAMLALSELEKYFSAPNKSERSFSIIPYHDTWPSRSDVANVCLTRWKYKNWALMDDLLIQEVESRIKAGVCPTDLLIAEFCLSGATFFLPEETLLNFASSTLNQHFVNEKVNCWSLKTENLSGDSYRSAIADIASDVPSAIIDQLCSSEHPTSQATILTAWRLLRQLRLSAWSPEQVLFYLSGHPYIPAWLTAVIYNFSLVEQGSSTQTKFDSFGHTQNSHTIDIIYDRFLKSTFARKLSEADDNLVAYMKSETLATCTELGNWMQPISNVQMEFNYVSPPCLIGQGLRNVWPVFSPLPRLFQSFAHESDLLVNPTHKRITLAFLHEMYSQIVSSNDHCFQLTKVYAASSRNSSAEQISESIQGHESVMFVWSSSCSMRIHFWVSACRDTPGIFKVKRGMIQNETQVETMRFFSRGFEVMAARNRLVFGDWLVHLTAGVIEHKKMPPNPELREYSLQYLEIFAID